MSTRCPRASPTPNLPRCCAPGSSATGRCAIAGIYLTDIPQLNYAEHLFQERTLRSVTANTRGDAAEFLTLARRLAIRVTTTPYPFGQADRALAVLAADRIHGAGVLILDQNGTSG